MTNALRAFPEISAWLAAREGVLLALDFDGTLCAIESSPVNVRLKPATLDALHRILNSGWITPAVISGRTIADLKGRIGLDLPLAGNHGLEIAGASLNFEHRGARLLRPSLEQACLALQHTAGKLPGAWVEDKGLSATLHFRNVEIENHEPLQDAARRSLKRFGDTLLLRQGKRVLEILPNFAWDKGEALRYLMQRKGPFDACICIGDDLTDEQMFRANTGQINIRVGEVELPSASHSLTCPSEVRAFLAKLADCRISGDYSCGGLLDATM